MRFNFIISAMMVVLLVLIFVLTGMTYLRNKVWTTKFSLWSDAAQKSPGKSRTHNNLGNCYMLLGKQFSAIEEYKKAVALDRNNIEPYYNLGMTLEDVGIMNQAIYYYDIFCKVAPPGYFVQKMSACKKAGNLVKGMK